MEVDPPQQVDDEQPSTNLQLSLNILQLIRAAQQQNGLKHGDYGRYRRYCARRLRSLHKSLKFLHGKGRYTKKRLDVSMITDARYLHIPLVNAERAWAYSLDLKKDLENAGGADPKQRYHSRTRLAKAARWAAELARLAAAVCDTRSALEADAYASWMAGLLELERESDWGAALKQLSRAKKLYGELSRVGDADSQAQCAAMVEEIEPSMRFCHYQIGRAGGGDGGAAASDLLGGLGERTGSEGLGGVGMDILQSRLAALQAEAQTQQAATVSTFEWRGARHPVRSEGVRLALHLAGQAAEAVDGGMQVDGGGGIEASLACHDRLVNALAEARRAVRAAINAATSGAADGGSAAAVEELSALEVAVAGVLTERTLQRNEAATADATARFEAAAAGAASGKRPPKGERPAKPEDLIRLHDTLAHHAHELSELAGRLGGRAGEALMDVCAAREATYLAGRCYWTAHAYLAASKWGEAAALFARAAQRADEALERLEDLPKGEAAVRAMAAAVVAPLRAKADAYSLVARAELAAEAAAEEDAVRGGIGALGLGGGAASGGRAGAQQPPAGFLADAVDRWEAFGGAPGGKGARVYSAPYPPQRVAVRPIMLDTAAAHIDYPDLSQRCARRPEQKSTFARLFGGWGATSTAGRS